MEKVIITADIHLLADDKHPINQNFYKFLKTDACDEVTKLYLIGDLFEVWIGDDINLPEYKTVIKILKDLTDSGLKIYLQYGNRDFLMGDAFWQATGITKLTEPTLIQLNGIEAILVHGDSLCTDDIDYQRMRKWFRSSIIQWLFLKLPQKTRIKIGEKMRQQSQQHSSNKTDAIMNVNQQAVAELFKQFPDCNNLIHGHTHQPKLHTFRLNKHTKHRWVLGDWSPKAEYIVITDKIEFKTS